MNTQAIAAHAFRDVSALGGLAFYAILCLLFFILDKEVLLLLLLGLLLLPVALLMRLVHFKHRPRRQRFRTWAERLDASSFPSIHSMRAAYLTVCIGGHYELATLSLLLAALAVLVCYSRYHLRKHDTVDILAGAGIGAAAAALATLL